LRHEARLIGIQGLMNRRYDLVVLGGGTAGLIASLYAARVGARVALVERADQPGGDCLFTGCVPSKSLIASARLAHEMRSARRLGLDPVEPRIDFARVMERVQEVIRQAGVRDRADHLEAQGVEVIRALGRFARPGVLDAGGRELLFRAAIIATGSRPALPPLPGLAQAEPLSAETVWDLRDLPPRLAVLGGGATGCELGQAFARLGSRVQIVEAAPVLLPREDPEAGRFVADTLAAEGVGVHLGTPAIRLEPARAGAGVLVAGERRVEYDRLLVALGRRPAGDAIGVENVGVELDERGFVKVDSRLQTSGDHIWAAGDAVGRMYFTHVAGHQGLTAMANALFRARRRFDYSAVPRVTFTDPEVASIGLTEAEARERLGRDPLVLRHDYAESDRALTEGRARGFAKLVTGRRGRLLGATLVAPAAGESIAELAALVRRGGTAADLSQAIHAYPTHTEGPARAAEEWWTERYLNPRGRRLLRPLLALLRALDRPRT
jgi:pyruvate/2-oxoglutarate dehydrogenase complex dihydrolipoamide dehydrogenase (E3) component